MNINFVEQQIESLATKAEKSNNGSDALKFSQAALNLAHAMSTIYAVKKEEDRT